MAVIDYHNQRLQYIYIYILIDIIVCSEYEYKLVTHFMTTLPQHSHDLLQWITINNRKFKFQEWKTLKQFILSEDLQKLCVVFMSHFNNRASQYTLS